MHGQIAGIKADVEQLLKGCIHVTVAGGAPTVQDSYNVAGLVDNGVGDFTITWDIDFANNYYAVGAACKESCFLCLAGSATFLAASVRIQTRSHAGALDDYELWTLMATGER